MKEKESIKGILDKLTELSETNLNADSKSKDGSNELDILSNHINSLLDDLHKNLSTQLNKSKIEQNTSDSINSENSGVVSNSDTSNDDRNQKLENVVEFFRSTKIDIPAMIFRIIRKMDGPEYFSYASPKTKLLLGINPEDLENDINLFWNLIHADYRDDLKSILIKSASDMSDIRKSLPFIINGKTFWYKLMCSVQLNSKDEIIWDGILIDESSQIKVENDLIKKDKLLRSIIDNAGDAFYLSEFDTGNIIDVNQQACIKTGYTREELLKMQVIEIDPTFKTFEDLKTGWEKLEPGQHITVESQHNRKDGSTFPVEIKITLVEINNHKYVLGFADDISERKTYEAELFNSKYSIDNASIGIFRISNEGKILSVNEQACLSLGYKCEELKKMYIYQIDDNFHKDRWKAHRQELIKKGSNVFETAHKRKDGSKFPVEIRNNYHEYDGVGFSIAFVTDITERKNAEQQIKKSENLLKEAQKIAHLGHYTFNIREGVWESSEVLDEVFGIYKDFDKSVEGWIKIVHPDYKDLMMDYLLESVVKNNKPFNYEYKIIRFNDQQERWVHGLGELEYDENGNPVYMIGTIQDITERKEIEQKLWRTQYSIDQALDAVYWITQNASIEYVNEAACKSLGYTREEFESLAIFDVDPVFPRENWDEHWAHTREKGAYVIETIHQTKSGEQFPVEISISFLKFNGNEYHCAFARDISERKKNEESLRMSESRLSEAQRIGKIGNWDWNIVDGELFWSDEVYRIFEFDKSKKLTVDSFFQGIHPDDKENVEKFISEAINAKKTYSVDLRILLPGNRIKHVHAEGKVSYDSSGNALRMYGIVQDINELKIAEEKLKSSLQEKDVLLKELYHRTKNNMQVISSMLALQASKVDHPEIKNVLTETQNRIQAMSLVHQKLYQSQNLSKIDLNEYIVELSHLLLRSYRISVHRIKLEFDLAKISLLLDYAIPCGLIINELLSNSLKHAFPDNKEGLISIKLRQSDEGVIKVSYSDNGVGVPADFNFKEQESLGLQSIISIGEHQLQGKVSFKNENGVGCFIEFRDSHYSSRV